jgi:hypothetical protein
VFPYRQDLQVEHHLEIIGEQHWHARRLLNSGGDVAMFRLRLLYLPFDLAALRGRASCHALKGGIITFVVKGFGAKSWRKTALRLRIALPGECLFQGKIFAILGT